MWGVVATAKAGWTALSAGADIRWPAAGDIQLLAPPAQVRHRLAYYRMVHCIFKPSKLSSDISLEDLLAEIWPASDTLQEQFSAHSGLARQIFQVTQYAFINIHRTA